MGIFLVFFYVAKKLHRLKVRKPKKSLNFNYELKIGSETYSIVSCSTGDTSSRDLFVMTLPLVNHSCVGLFYFFKKNYTKLGIT